MSAQDFSHVQTWVFDLDNTLYPPQARLCDQIEIRMTNWVMEALGVDKAEADHLRQVYWRDYGTTRRVSCLSGYSCNTNAAANANN